MTIEKSLRDFNFWSNAANNAAKLTPEELDAVEEILEETLDWDRNEPYSTTEINDLFRYSFETVCEWLGLDYEEVMARE